jgi:crotonobetainyl-CoA:carnitine CoA-transferase CaiB-like acyl-CoA transferase
MQLYRTKDGRWLLLSGLRPDRYWSSFCKAIGRDELEKDPRFDSFEGIIVNHVDLLHILEEVFASKNLAEWKPLLDASGVPWSPLQTLPEVVADPQARANEFFTAFQHPVHGPVEVVANPVKLDRKPHRVRMPAPEFSQHTEEVLLEMGYSWEEIERFKQLGIIA